MSEEDFKRLLKESRKSTDESLKKISKELNELKSIIEVRILPSLSYVETTVKSYADRYVTNEDHIGRLNTRLHTVEENLGIQPPEELTIPVLD